MKFKKYLSLFIAVCMMFSLPVISFANDYDGHWAYSDIEYLINKNIVIPNDGVVRPDEFITRAEFVKVINNIFEIPQINTDNIYLDLSEDKWYYSEILKATGYGILSGDGTGYCYPENKITRAEASVILSRVLKLDIKPCETAFSDNSEIPSWARPYIALLVKKGVINGYTDNTFKAQNNITRAEAFSLSVRSSKTLNEEMPMTETPQSPAISAGGGGGGVTVTPPAISLGVPVIKRIDTETNKLYFSEIFGASNYEVSLTITTLGKSGTQTVSTSLTEVDLTDKINTLSGNEKSQVETFNVKVRAVSGLLYSSYSETVDFSIVNTLPDAISVPKIESNTELVNQTEKVYFEWDVVSDASCYELYIDFEDGQGYTLVNNSLTNKVYLTDYVSLDNLKESYNVKFKVLSNNPELEDSLYVNESVKVSLYGGKEGDYDIILSKRHFLNIEKNPSGKYLLKADLDLGNYTPFEFSGTFKGDNTENLRTINLNITDSAGKGGLFSVISGSVNISDIKLSGSVTSSFAGGVGGIAAKINSISNKGDASLKNIVNYADITSSSNTTASYAGGIIGDAYGDASSQYMNVSYLVNYGDIKGGTAAGIFAYMRGKVSYCANHGEITSTRLGAGGILGNAYASVDASYNTGDIYGATNAGGIIASTSIEQASISNCFNTGNVTSTDGNASGILGSHSTNTARQVYIYNCYNTGILSSTVKTGEIYIQDLNLGNLFASNNYYISDNHTLDEDDGYTGTYPITSQDLEDITNLKKTEDGTLREFSQSAWRVTQNIYNYKYPQLILNPYRVKSRELSAPSVYDVSSDVNNKVFVTVKGDANTESYTLKVFDSNNELGSYNLTGGSEVTQEITDLLNGFNKDYTIKITANGDGLLYLSKDGSPYTYKHIEYIAPPLGEGTKESPYIISRIENFKYLNTYGQDKHYKITCDLDFTGANSNYFVILGETENTAFSGSITGDKNGDKPVIKLDIENDGANGFVRYLKGDISNFIMEGQVSGKIGVGSVAGYMLGGTILNIENKANVISINQADSLFNAYAGGIVGSVIESNPKAEIKNCINYADVSPGIYAKAVGGIVGHVKSGSEVTIRGCGNSGDVKGFSNVGGIIGFIDRATDKTVSILLSYNLGKVTVSAQTPVAKDNSGFGGILGNGSATIDQCFNSGIVEGCNNTGGIVGLYETVSVNITLSNSYNSGNIKPLATTNSYKNNGGLTGACNVANSGTASVTIKNNYNGGSVTFNRAHWPVYVSAPASAVISNNYYISTLSSSTLSLPSGTTAVPSQISETSMSYENSFAGFDFTDIWEINEADDYKYPQLKENSHKIKEIN